MHHYFFTHVCLSWLHIEALGKQMISFSPGQSILYVRLLIQWDHSYLVIDITCLCSYFLSPYQSLPLPPSHRAIVLLPQLICILMLFCCKCLCVCVCVDPCPNRALINESTQGEVCIRKRMIKGHPSRGGPEAPAPVGSIAWFSYSLPPLHFLWSHDKADHPQFGPLFRHNYSSIIYNLPPASG